MTAILPPERVAALSDEYLAGLFAAYPTLASSLGLHEYDGRVPDFRETARAQRATALRSWAARLADIPAASLAPEDAHDHTLLSLAADEELFELESLREVERNPMAFSGALDVSGYVKRNYAPLAQRVAALCEHLRHFPDVLAVGRATLRRQIPLPFLETSLDVYKGTVEFLEHDLPAAVRPVGPDPLWTTFEQTTADALAALRAFIGYLEDDLRPHATQEFAIGEERFSTMVRLGEMVELSTDRLLEIGRDDMARNHARLRAVTSRVAPGAPIEEVMRRRSHDHPSADRLVPEAARLLEELREFVTAHGVVSIPSEVRCRVEPTPPFARWAFAMMDTAGPFEAATESYYYVTPPEAAWTPEQQEEWLAKFDYATLRDVGIHEVYPGHYVHFLHLKDVRRRLRQVLTSYSFVEGWAHYCEEMMLEAGYRTDDPSLQIAQLAEALLRDVRFVVSIQMHTRSMSIAEASRMFVEEAYLEPLTAEKEAIRGTFDPGYLNYTLGKLMIRRLRDDVRTKWGGQFTLRAFHDGLLALGAPPVPLARRRLVGPDSGAL
jgi:uncharacterized protein (DUF885 family)